MTNPNIRYKITRSNTSITDHVNVCEDDYKNTEKELVKYFSKIYNAKILASLIPTLAYWSTNKTASIDHYTQIMKDDTNLPYTITVYVKRI